MENTRTESNVRLRGEERRQQIIDTARRLFAQRGFSGTTTQEIADAAGISNTLIFQHFGSKEKLFEAVIQASYGMQSITDVLDGQAPSEGDENICRSLAAHNFAFAHETEGREMMRLLTYISLEKPTLYHQHLLEEGAEAIELIADYFSTRIAAGAFKDVNPVIAAYAFLGMIRNYMWNMHITGEENEPRYPDDEVIDTFVSIFLNGMRR